MKWRQWRSKLKQKKCKPLLGPEVEIVWRRLQSSNKNANLNTVSGQSRHQTIFQALTCSVTAQQHKSNSDTTVLSLSKQKPVLTKHQPEHNDRCETRHQITNQSFTHSKMPQEHEKNVPKTVPWRYGADPEQENSCKATNNLMFCKPFGLCGMIKKLITLTLKCQ